MNALLDSENETQHWRRNFIRTSASLIEGYTHCYREMSAVSLACGEPEISTKELKILQSEKTNTNERIKYTLSAAYKIFQLEPPPDFGGDKGNRIKRVFKKRDILMHPKTPADLEISDDLYNQIRDDVAWLMEQLFKFISLLELKHSD